MSTITLEEVTIKKNLKKFFKFPFESVYKNDKNWAAPLWMEMTGKFDPKKNTFFKYGEVVAYIAVRDEKVVGRITAQISLNHNKFHNEKTGFFGFFECIDDQEVANVLFDKAKEFIKSKGMDVMRGPASFTSNDEFGLLIENFNEPPFILMTYNPPYYQKLMENYGMQKSKDLLAFKLDMQTEWDPKVARVAEKIKTRNNIVVRPINMKNFKEEVKIIREIYNKAWEKNWGFIPMEDDEFDHLAKQLKTIVEPKLALIAFVDGKPAGFSLAIPDVNQLAVKMTGKPDLIYALYVLLNMKKVKRGRLAILGVVKEFRMRGIEAVFYWETYLAGKSLGYKEGELSWILEDNTLMIRGIESTGAKVYRKYRVYDTKLA